MAKLGYTWYPKDWGNSEKVFELTLIERGLYRELIDMAMLNDNKTVINIKVWSRKYGSSINEVEGILITLTELGLIEVDKDNLFIPSCEPRLNMVRGASKGGKKSKPTAKSISNLKGSPTESLLESPTETKGKEKKLKEIEKKEIPVYSDFLNFAASKKPKLNPEELKLKYDSWIENDWKDGNDRPIKNWKSKILNTLPYISETTRTVNTNPVLNREDFFTE